MSIFKFAELVPEEIDEFELADGSKIPFRSELEFDAVDVAKFRSLQARFEKLEEDFKVDQADIEAGETMDRLAKDMVKMMLPALPDEILAELHLPQLELILNFWLDQQAARDKKKKSSQTASKRRRSSKRDGSTGRN